MQHVGNDSVKRGAMVVLGLGLWLAAASGAQAHDEEDLVALPEERFALGIGGGAMRFDTNFKFTDTGTGRSVFIDSEGTFGLPEQKTIPVIYGSWRPSQKHGLGFSYFSVRRDSEFIAFDENLGDLNLTGFARLQDDGRVFLNGCRQVQAGTGGGLVFRQFKP